MRVNKGEYTKLYQKHIPNFIAAKLVCVDNRFTLPTIILVVVIVLKNLLNRFFNKKSIVIKKLINILTKS